MKSGEIAFRKLFPVGIAFALLFGLIPVIAQASEILYGITFFNQELITIDPTTGAGTLVGPLDPLMKPFGLAARGSELYTYDQTAGVVVKLDPASGATIATIDVGIKTRGEGSIAFRSDGIGFLTQSVGLVGTLWSFDITVPSATQITSAGGLNPSIDGLDFNGSNVLYGLRQSPIELYTINQITGVTTLVGDTGLDSFSDLGGLAFRSNGMLYAAINDGINDDALYILDPLTASATFIGSIGFADVSGLVFLSTPSSSSTSLPEPGTFLLFGIGLLGLLGLNYRQRQRHLAARLRRGKNADI
ncbi:PEP-CTERM sorting domain-containing protein [Candidatus Poribacteria bacterium]|nr:PEP-CTERM sorting domain-containing protein [Candidatus Poribacteria bacterium]